MGVNISVIIPVYNAEKEIERCIASLLSLSYPKEAYELLFINNNSTDATASILAKNAESISILTEEKPTSYAARNKGIANASGKIIAFTDSDCVVDDNWLFQIEKTFNDNPNISAIQGKSGVFNKTRNSLALQYKYDDIFKTEVIREDGTCNRIDTRNTAIKKDVIDKVGLFNDSLAYWGDIEYGFRIIENGFPILFATDVIIEHINIEDINIAVEKRKKQGYRVAKDFKKMGIRYVNRYFRDMLYIFYQTDNISQRRQVCKDKIDNLYIQATQKDMDDESFYQLIAELYDFSFLYGAYTFIDEGV